VDGQFVAESPEGDQSALGFAAGTRGRVATRTTRETAKYFFELLQNAGVEILQTLLVPSAHLHRFQD
jgi:hypothetical protein